MEDKIICPQCKKITVSGKGNKYRPFCSRRCKLIDLGEWSNTNQSKLEKELDELIVEKIKQQHKINILKDQLMKCVKMVGDGN